MRDVIFYCRKILRHTVDFLHSPAKVIVALTQALAKRTGDCPRLGHHGSVRAHVRVDAVGMLHVLEEGVRRLHAGPRGQVGSSTKAFQLRTCDRPCFLRYAVACISSCGRESLSPLTAFAMRAFRGTVCLEHNALFGNKPWNLSCAPLAVATSHGTHSRTRTSSARTRGPSRSARDEREGPPQRWTHSGCSSWGRCRESTRERSYPCNLLNPPADSAVCQCKRQSLVSKAAG